MSFPLHSPPHVNHCDLSQDQKSVCLFWTVYNGSIRCVLLCIWFLLLSFMLTILPWVTGVCSFLLPQYIYPFHSWWTSGSLPTNTCYEQDCVVDIVIKFFQDTGHTVLLGIYIRSESLGHRTYTRAALVSTVKNFPVILLAHTPMSNVQHSNCSKSSSTLDRVYFILAIGAW